MATILIIASIALICLIIFIISLFTEKQKKKTLLVGMISKALLELNQNKEILKIVLKVLKPRELIISTSSEAVKENREENKSLPIALNPPIFQHEEIELLKTSNEFLIYSDISLSVELNNVILRIKYLNQLLPEIKNLTVLSADDFKTAFHTYEMIEKLILDFEGMLKKLKN